MSGSSRLSHYLSQLDDVDPIRVQGTVQQVVGGVIEGRGPAVAVGGLCDLYPSLLSRSLKAEVIGFKGPETLLMPLGDLRGVRPGSRIVYRGEQAVLRVTAAMQGRVLNGLGEPIDDGDSLPRGRPYPLYREAINPLKKKRIEMPLDVGIRAVNGLLTCGKGQRLGIFAGSGVGKSRLLGAIARHARADVNVIALIGERGREVREFIEQNLGETGQQKTVMVVATSDQPPLVRLRGAFVATAIAEFFRDQGQDVLLLLDSLTRLAMAQREVGLAVGEPPTARGYTPSVFSLLPRLLERAGNADGAGSLTGFYTVLIENDDINDPIADAVRSIVDGHIVLSRDLAAKNHYPAIDMMHSLSRVMSDLTTASHQAAASRLRELLAVYREAEDLISIGAYTPGSSEKIDVAIAMLEAVTAYLRQNDQVCVSYEASVEHLETLLSNVSVPGVGLTRQRELGDPDGSVSATAHS